MHGSLATRHEFWIRQTTECVQIRVQTLESGQDQIVNKLMIYCQSVLDCSVLILKIWNCCLNGSWSKIFFWRQLHRSGQREATNWPAVCLSDPRTCELIWHPMCTKHRLVNAWMMQILPEYPVVIPNLSIYSAICLSHADWRLLEITSTTPIGETTSQTKRFLRTGGR